MGQGCYWKYELVIKYIEPKGLIRVVIKSQAINSSGKEKKWVPPEIYTPEKECAVGRLRGSYRVEEHGWEVRRRDGGVITETQWELGVEAWVHDWGKSMEWWGPEPGEVIDITSNGGKWSVVGSHYSESIDNIMWPCIQIQMGSSIDDGGHDIVSYIDGYIDNGRLQEDEWEKRSDDMCRFNREVGDEAVSWTKKVDSISLGEDGSLLWTSVGQILGYSNI